MMNTRKLFLIITAIIGIWSAGCGGGNPQKVAIDTTITPATSYNNLFLDSTAIHHFIEKDTIYKPFENLFINFYRQRNFEFAWFDSSGLVEQAHNFIYIQNNDTATFENNDSSIMNTALSKIADKYQKGIPAGEKHTSIVDDELTLTGEFFKRAQTIFQGKNDLDAEQLGWFIPRKKVDFSELLDSTLKGSNLPDNDLLNPQFKSLQQFLKKYIALKKKEKDWDSIPLLVTKLQMGDSGKTVRSIQRRLHLLGDLEDDFSKGKFDLATKDAVKSFQERNGLASDGVVGARFMDAINTPIDSLIRTIAVNLERARWIPTSFPPDYIWVNMPEYKLHVFQDAQEAFSMNVIVGSAAHGTTIFSGNIKYIVFAPYWNVPASIVKKEIVPGIAKDPNYIAHHNMQITGYSNKIPIVRQLPGPDNALGRVKFLFPNNYNIYLHDTPNHDLFDARNRGLSHGCVRLSDPEKMANWLLRDDSVKYSSEIIDSLMNKNTKETWVTLKNTVPVFLVYFTTWVDHNGKLNVRKDIYGHDAKIAAKLFSN